MTAAERRAAVAVMSSLGAEDVTCVAELAAGRERRGGGSTDAPVPGGGSRFALSPRGETPPSWLAPDVPADTCVPADAFSTLRFRIVD